MLTEPDGRNAEGSIAAWLTLASVLFALLTAGCRSPTQITFQVTTDVPCAQLGETFVTAGAIGVFDEGLPPTTTAPRCTTEGQIGSVVVIPTSGDDALIGVEAVVGVNSATSSCATDPSTCIVAKRALHFIPHEPLTVLVGLDAACTGIVCDGEQTCVSGTCKSAVIEDPGQCSGGGCGDTALGSVDGGPMMDAASGGDATIPVDAGADATVPVDAAPDAPAAPPVEASSDAGVLSCPGPADAAVVVTIAPATANPSATGLGQQRHLVVESGCHFHYFYPSDDGSKILSRTSDDFSTWADGDVIGLLVLDAGLTLGSDFALAYAEIGGSHVLHVLAEESNPFETGAPIHLRTTISGGHFTTPTTYLLPEGAEDNACSGDGPSVLITADGRVFDATGWITHAATFTHCDMNVLQASGPDDGTSFSGAFTLVGYSWSAPAYTYAHDLVELPSKGTILAAYPDLDPGVPQNAYALAVISSPFDAGYGQAAPASEELFESDGGPEAWFGDWGLCRLSDTDVHAIRHVFGAGDPSTSAFQALRFDGTSWGTDAVPQASSGVFNQGLAVVSGADPARGMVLATIDADGTTLDLQMWSPGTNTWAMLPSITRPQPIQSLTGSGCGSARPSVFWTEGTGSSYAVEAADLSAYLH